MSPALQGAVATPAAATDPQISRERAGTSALREGSHRKSQDLERGRTQERALPDPAKRDRNEPLPSLDLELNVSDRTPDDRAIPEFDLDVERRSHAEGLEIDGGELAERRTRVYEDLRLPSARKAGLHRERTHRIPLVP